MKRPKSTLLIGILATFATIHIYGATPTHSRNFKDWSSRILESENISARVFRAGTVAENADLTILLLDRYSSNCSKVRLRVLINFDKPFENDFSQRGLFGQLRIDERRIRTFSFDLAAAKADDSLWITINPTSTSIVIRDLILGHTARVRIPIGDEAHVFRFSLRGSSAAIRNSLTMCNRYAGRSDDSAFSSQSSRDDKRFFEPESKNQERGRHRQSTSGASNLGPFSTMIERTKHGQVVYSELVKALGYVTTANAAISDYLDKQSTLERAGSIFKRNIILAESTLESAKRRIADVGVITPDSSDASVRAAQDIQNTLFGYLDQFILQVESYKKDAERFMQRVLSGNPPSSSELYESEMRRLVIMIDSESAMLATSTEALEKDHPQRHHYLSIIESNKSLTSILKAIVEFADEPPDLGALNAHLALAQSAVERATRYVTTGEDSINPYIESLKYSPDYARFGRLYSELARAYQTYRRSFDIEREILSLENNLISWLRLAMTGNTEALRYFAEGNMETDLTKFEILSNRRVALQNDRVKSLSELFRRTGM